MMKLRFYVNEVKIEARERSQELKAIAKKFGFEVNEEVSTENEVIVSLGGDGTFLRAVHEFPELPILGINMGGLGYLAGVGISEAETAFRLLSEGRYTISKRSLLEVNGKYRALNDVVIVRELSGHSACLDLEADGRFVTRYMADGLIFSTPTGSTAYSLAAGGPVVTPTSPCTVVTPMNPHALSVRPLVIDDEVKFKVTAHARTAGNEMKIGVYADGGNVITLDEGMSVEIAKSEKTAMMIELEGYDPYAVLARKLGWNGSNVR